jgi:DNA polymerase V
MKSIHPNVSSHSTTGFSAAGGDFRGKRLSLDSLLETNPASTFFLRAEEKTTLGGVIHPGDILVVDKSADTKNGCLVVAVVDGEMVLRQVVHHGRQIRLHSEKSPGEQEKYCQAQIWGKVVYVLHPVQP